MNKEKWQKIRTTRKNYVAIQIYHQITCHTHTWVKTDNKDNSTPIKGKGTGQRELSTHCVVGWSEKNFNRKKCSSQILANGLKLVENLF